MSGEAGQYTLIGVGPHLIPTVRKLLERDWIIRRYNSRHPSRSRAPNRRREKEFNNLDSAFPLVSALSSTPANDSKGAHSDTGLAHIQCDRQNALTKLKTASAMTRLLLCFAGERPNGSKGRDNKLFTCQPRTIFPGPKTRPAGPCPRATWQTGELPRVPGNGRTVSCGWPTSLSSSWEMGRSGFKWSDLGGIKILLAPAGDDARCWREPRSTWCTTFRHLGPLELPLPSYTCRD